jgi:sugar phosphate isomerase/epimerase
VLDVGHVWWERDIEPLIAAHVDAIVTVQLTNVDASALDELRYDRAPLAHGEIAVADLVDALERAGYAGWYENEVLTRGSRDDRLAMLRADREWFAAR